MERSRKMGCTITLLFKLYKIIYNNTQYYNAKILRITIPGLSWISV